MVSDKSLIRKPGFARAELYGSTEFGIGLPAKPVKVDIVVGYRKRIINDVPQKYVYATLSAGDDKYISLEDIINAWGGSTADIPEILLSGIRIKSFGVSYGASVNASSFKIILNTSIRLDKKDFDATITIKYNKGGGDKTFVFGGALKIGGGHIFDLVFKRSGNAKGSEATYLFASYRRKGVTHIDLREISARIFGDDARANTPALSFDLEDFKAFILYRRQEGESGLLFGMGAVLDVKLQDLPMAGPIIARDGSFSFDEVLVMYSRGSFKKTEFSDFPGVPKIDVTPGFNISSSIIINNQAAFYVLNDGAEKAYPDETEPVKPAAVESISGAVSSKAKWTKIDKKLGPVHLQRLGFLYDKGKVVLLLDAGLSMAGMGMQLIGLGAGFKLAWPPGFPEFYIDGLGLSYTKDPVRISGMFTRVAPKPDLEFYSYYGSAQLSFSKFNISGVGGYSKLKPGGDTSMFIYAMYQGAIGGPSFFFVTGIAAGFGYNRSVRIPKITDVATFPLVAMALNPVPAKSLNEILAELIIKDCIPASPGDYWLAIGVKFTSFKIIESFVLVIVQFGTHTEFTVLGLSILAWPDKASPIAYVELALKANFGSNSDVLSIEAMLTPNSYILDKNCKLTGGFAFYAWVSGDHEGDFVISLGGYHPRFIKPKHYPDVQRLGLNWRISRELQIKGGLYYALTPSCIMAGGKLEITYTLSFLRGSIVVWADMLIGWAPFRYAVDMGIAIRIEANIDMGLFYVRFNLEMGAQLHLWGPPFAGSVYVDWSIFSFTIPFGAAQKTENQALPWNDFRKQFIPGKAAPAKPALLRGSAKSLKANTNEQIFPAAEIMITEGVINEYTVGSKKYILVNPHKLKLKVEAPVPVMTLQIEKKEIENTTEMQVNGRKESYNDRNTSLGIRPMGEDKLISVLDIAVTGDSELVYSTYANSVPEALWSPSASKGSNSSPDESRVLAKALKGMVFAPREEGVPTGTLQLDLDGKFDLVTNNLRWEYIPAYTGPDNAPWGDHVKDEIIKRLNDRDITGAAGRRQAMIKAALTAQGTTVSGEVSSGIPEWVKSLAADPVIVQVGGVPQYKPESGKGIMQIGKKDNNG